MRFIAAAANALGNGGRHRAASTSARVTHVQSGFTLIEVLVAVAIIGALAALAVPSIGEMREAARMRGVAREAANMFEIARSEAVRTATNQLVFFGPPGTTDPAANPIEDGGVSVPMLILSDGFPSTANCHIDGGEARESLAAQSGVGWGVSDATSRPANDSGAVAFSAPHSSGATFADPDGVATNWVLFRPDGVPVGVDPTATTCGTIGEAGSGAGALYFTNGSRDYAVAVSPLGSVTIHVWSEATGSWR